MTPEPTITPAPTLDLLAWSSSVDAQLVAGVDLLRLVVLTVLLVGGVLVAVSIGHFVSSLGD